MGTGMEPGTPSTTTQQDFMLTMAAMETDLCQARWEALASAPHIGEVIKNTPKKLFLKDVTNINRTVETVAAYHLISP